MEPSMQDEPQPAGSPALCPRCGGTFLCNAAGTGPCQCSTARLTDAVRASIAREFSGCLCIACLLEMATLTEPDGKGAF